MAHCQMDDVLVYPALSTDYAAMVNAALSLFEATGDRTFIRDAIALKEALDANNRDASGNYRLSALNAEDVILHSYGDYDEAIPSATSQIIEAFTRLFLVTGDLHLYTQNERLVELAMGRALVQQYGQIGILNASRFAAEPLSLVIAEESVDGELSLLAQRIPDPRRVDKFIQFEAGKAIELPTGGTANADKPSAWLCKGQVCLAPVETPAALEILLRGHS